MLANEKNDLLYLLNILEYIGKVWRYTEEANNAEELFEIITNDLKLLKTDIEKIITDKIKSKIFDIEEVKISKESQYYKYIKFENIVE